MIFKFPQKKIVLNCFTSNAEVIEYAPINHAIKLMPEWWVNLPKSYPNEDGFTELGTMKYCSGMVDYYKKSIAIPLWAEFAIKIYANGSYSYKFADYKTQAGNHNLKQQANNFQSGFGHLKIISPWVLKTKEKIDWVWSHPTYNYQHGNDINHFPGITNFYYQHSTNLNITFSLEKEKTIVLPHGQTMAILTPMSDKKVEIVRHLISDEEFQKIQMTGGIVFVNRLKKIIEKKQQFSKCPYQKG